MKANRKTMLGVALAVAVIALAGIGYAAAGGYFAQTTAAPNDATAKYIVLTLADDGTNDNADKKGTTAYEGQTVVIEWNTVTGATAGTETTTYTMKEAKVTMNYIIHLTGANTSTDTFTLAFNLPTVDIPGVSAQWVWKNADIVTNYSVDGQAISDIDGGILSLELTPNGSRTTAPGTGAITIGSIGITVTESTA